MVDRISGIPSNGPKTLGRLTQTILDGETVRVGVLALTEISNKGRKCMYIDLDKSIYRTGGWTSNRATFFPTLLQ